MGNKYSYYITVNAAKFSDIKFDEDGSTGDDDSFKLDRILAHELTHSYVQIGMKKISNKVPSFVHEGLAEITQGADDFRYSQIYQVLSEADTFNNTFQIASDGDSKINAEQYASAYMFMRYLARQLATEGVPYISNANFIPYYGIGYANNNQTIVAKSGNDGYTGTIDLRNYATNGITFDASKYFARDSNDKTISIVGTDHNDKIYLPWYETSITPGKGDDTIIDTNSAHRWNRDYYFGSSDGTNTIVGANANTTIHLTAGKINRITYYDGMVGIWSGNTSIYVSNITENSNTHYQQVSIIDSTGKRKTYSLDENKGVGYYSNGTWTTASTYIKFADYYYSNDDKTLYLRSKFTGTVDLSKYKATVTAINATAAKNNLTFSGNGKAATIWFGKGKDTIIYGKGSNINNIYNFDSINDEVKLKAGSQIIAVGSNGNNVYMRVSNNNDVLGLMGMLGKAFKLNGRRSQILNQGTKSANVVTYGRGSGLLDVYGFNSSKDELKTTSGSSLVSVGTNSSNVYLRYGSGDNVVGLMGMLGKTFKLNGRRSQILNQGTKSSNVVTYGKGNGLLDVYGFNSSKDELKTTSGSSLVCVGTNSSNVYLRYGSGDNVVGLMGMLGKTFKLNGRRSQILNQGTKSSNVVTYGKGNGLLDVYGFNSSKDEVRTTNGSQLLKVGINGSNVYLRYGSGDNVIGLMGMLGKTFKLNGKSVTIKRNGSGTPTLYTTAVSGDVAASKNSLSYLTQVQAVDAPASSLTVDTGLNKQQNTIRLAAVK